MGTEDDKRYKDVVAMDEKVLKLHLKREPRFYAHIAADRCYYQLGKKNVLVEAYRGERFGTREASKFCSAKFDRLLDEEGFGFRSF